MSQPEQNDPLDALLRDQNPYLKDDGFTARVIATLPARRRSLAWLRPTLLLGSSVVGAFLAVRWLPWESLPSLDLSTVLSFNTPALLPWVAVFSVAGALVWAAMVAIPWED